MGVRLEIDLDDGEAELFAMLFREIDINDPSTRWTPNALFKSMAMGVLIDDLESHRKSETVN